MVSSTNKTDPHEITEILLKMALNTIKPNHIHVVLSSIHQVIFYVIYSIVRYCAPLFLKTINYFSVAVPKYIASTTVVIAAIIINKTIIIAYFVKKKNYESIFKKRNLLALLEKLEDKIPKGQSEAVYRCTDNTMANTKRTKGQTLIYKTLHRKQRIEQCEPHMPGR